MAMLARLADVLALANMKEEAEEEEARGGVRRRGRRGLVTQMR